MKLTKEGLKKLEYELEELKQTRKEIALRIKRAKEFGDLSENAEYSEAKDAQTMNDSKIAELEDQIRTAEVVDEVKIKNLVQIGSTIKVKEGRDEKEYTIVGANEADPIKGLVSNESPLGMGFLGKNKGDNVEVQLPSRTAKFKIIDVA